MAIAFMILAWFFLVQDNLINYWSFVEENKAYLKAREDMLAKVAAMSGTTS